MAIRLQSLCVCVGLVVCLLVVKTCTGQFLSNNFYANSCPNVAGIVRGVISANLPQDPTAPAALLRLLFHDCQVQGCDGSILLDTQGGIVSEREASANLGIRRLDFIDRIKTALEFACPNTVSCADIVVLSAREAVRIAGGPFIDVSLGRRDSTTASSATASAELPTAETQFNGFLQVFLSKGMSLEESVAILGGGHTLGVGHCASIVNRLYPQRDRNLGFGFYNVLRLRCPPRYGPRAVVPNDLTFLAFDTQYFAKALAGRGLFRVDADVATNPQTRRIVQFFSSNPNAFFQAFSSAFLKLSLTGLLTGGQGEIRRNCRFVNN